MTPVHTGEYGQSPDHRDLASPTAAVRFGRGGLPRRFDIHGLSIPMYPAGALEDGTAGLYLRVRGTPGSGDGGGGENHGHRPSPLIGVTSGGMISWTPDGPTCRTETSGIHASTSFRLGRDIAGWFWHISLTNTGSTAVEVDVVAVQDVALAPYPAVRNNEYYVSQYLDVTPVPIAGHGTALAVRQNMPGDRQPWALVGGLTEMTGWATDALQLTGPTRLDGEPLPGLATDLPSARLQHEHTLTALQTAPITLAAGASVDTGFFGIVLPDHPAATSEQDAGYAAMALADPAAIPPSSDPDDDKHDSPGDLIVASRFGAAPGYPCREGVRGSDDPASVAGTSDQRAALRPHGQLMRTGGSLVPDERTVTSTAWMAGGLWSHVTQGHVGFGSILSVRRGYLGLQQASGLRLFVAPPDDPSTTTTVENPTPATEKWLLLGTPTRWEQRLDGCSWIYESDGAADLPARLIVTAQAPTEAHELRLTVESDRPVRLLAAAHFSGGGDDGAQPAVVQASCDADGATVSVGQGTVRLAWPTGSVESVAGDGPLLLDGRSVGAPWLTLTVPPTTSWALTLTPELIPAQRLSLPTDALDNGFWDRVRGGVTVRHEGATSAAAELRRIDEILPWFAHDALIHYLSPRGLEQFSGGGWGTRDVSQGPVGLLLAHDAPAALREVVLHLLRAQNARGNWPQSFEMYDRYIVFQQQDAHGDVVLWPILAIAEYLEATGDSSLLAEQVPFVGDGSATVSASTIAHLEKALEHLESTRIPGTSLPAYGHGDWNDSLQPADPALAAGLCSTWTVTLQAHALGTLARALEALPDIDSRTRRLADRTVAIAAAGTAQMLTDLLADGVLAGYGFYSGGHPAPSELLVHPRDGRTGLTYSVLPMIHAISGDLLTREQAAQHLQLIAEHLTGPDGARLFDRPAQYHGGPMQVFRRAEASTFFGREIGIMYTHAHLRYAEALARFGDAEGFLRALALANPIGMTERVRSARPRQQTTYYSSSDGVFADRYAAADGYARLLAGEVPLEGGWRVYSSGPGIYLRLVVENLLGIRRRGAVVHIDPVLPADLDGLTATVPLSGRSVSVHYRIGTVGSGVLAVRCGGRELVGTLLENPYRRGGVAVRTDELVELLGSDPTLEVEIA